MQINPITVTQLNKYIKDKFSSDEVLQNVLIKGELSNFKKHYTGHLYFTLKDDASLIKGIMFKTYTGNLKFEPKDGMSVVIFGTVSVFERDGQYQIYCKDMMLDGVGALYQAYEELKEKLEKEGLFAQSHKKVIPFFSKTIGVITSQTGSVIKDIINVSTRRNPNVHLKLMPSAVQGEGASLQIKNGIEKFNELKNVDVIILARGGGSLEDLWPFNEEIVARSIYNSSIPVISAVGHETDFTISDFVADLRAPTPSAAAEIAVTDVSEVKWKLESYKNSLKILLNKKYSLMKNLYEKCIASRTFSDPMQIIVNKQLILDNDIKNIVIAMNKIINLNKNKYIKIISILDTLSPLKTLERGYALIESKDKKIINKAVDLKINDIVDIIFQDGNKIAKIIE